MCQHANLHHCNRFEQKQHWLFVKINVFCNGYEKQSGNSHIIIVHTIQSWITSDSILKEMLSNRCSSLVRALCSLHQTSASSRSSSKTGCLRSYHSSRTLFKQNNGPVTTNSEEDRQVKYLELEISLLRESRCKVPDINSLDKHHWNELLTMKSKSARLKYYHFLFIKEKRKENKAVSESLKVLLTSRKKICLVSILAKATREENI